LLLLQFILDYPISELRLTGLSIISEFQQVFRERGPPDELLLDNSAIFWSQRFRELCSRWCVKLVYRCAYRPAGNGIVEHNHRTIKRLAARSNVNPLDMVYWYNVTHREDSKKDSVPACLIHKYGWRTSFDGVAVANKAKSVVDVGEAVYVKPLPMRCTSIWPVGTVTAVNSATNVDVNGIPRHVADIRAVGGEPEAEGEDEDEAEVEARGGDEHRYPKRTRKPPDRYVP
jgi:hypothetical protein